MSLFFFLISFCYFVSNRGFSMLQKYKNFNKKYIIYKVIFIRSLKKFRHKAKKQG